MTDVTRMRAKSKGSIAKPSANDQAPHGPSAIGKYHLTDTGNGRRLADRHGDNLRYCWPWSKWFIWDGRRWAVDADGAVYVTAKETLASLYQWAADQVAEIARQLKAEEGDPDDLRKRQTALNKLMGFCIKSEAAPRVRAMIDMARSEPGIPVRPDQLDREPFLLNCINGTIDLRTGKLREHRREDLITKLCPVAYDPDAGCPLWDRLVLDAMEENKDLMEFLQRAIGYALTGSVREQCLFFFYGAGQNGKSTILTILQEMLGDYAMQGVSELLMVRQNEQHPTERADLFGRRFVATIETEDGKRMAEALLKQLTGGDRIRARRMREDFWEFAPTHKLFLAANYKPVIRGDDFAVWRRIKLVPFNYTVPPEKKDPDLPEKLRAELPGILAWAVRGCLDWQKIGLAEPEEVCQATTEYRAEMDVIGDFLNSCCLVNPEVSVKATELYEAYCRWIGNDELTQRAFATKLKRRNFESKPGAKGYFFWRGIGLRK